VLRGFAVPDATAIFAALHGITIQAPFRYAVSGRLGCHQLEVGKP
jgi:hypothetical protein